MKYSACKEINRLINCLIRAGWRYYRGGKHGRLASPDGRAKLSVPGTPSDRRAFLNFRRDIRHAQES